MSWREASPEQEKSLSLEAAKVISLCGIAHFLLTSTFRWIKPLELLLLHTLLMECQGNRSVRFSSPDWSRRSKQGYRSCGLWL